MEKVTVNRRIEDVQIVVLGKASSREFIAQSSGSREEVIRLMEYECGLFVPVYVVLAMKVWNGELRNATRQNI